MATEQNEQAQDLQQEQIAEQESAHTETEVTAEDLQQQISVLAESLKLEKARTANAVYEAQKSVERIQRESEKHKDTVLEKFAKELLDTVDNLERAIAAAGEDNAMVEGVKLTLKSLLTTLEKFGVTKDKVEIWGTGSPRREFMWSKDMADACIFIMEKIDFINTYNKDIKEIKNTHINIGTGKDISIKELAILIKNIVGYSGELYFNIEKPDGTILKRTDVSKLHKLGWKYKIELEEGVKRIYEWYKNER